jgi:hypothetical protein
LWISRHGFEDPFGGARYLRKMLGGEPESNQKLIMAIVQVDAELSDLEPAS